MDVEILKKISQVYMFKDFMTVDIENSQSFSSIQYKVLQKCDDKYLIPCREIEKDEKKQLIYVFKAHVPLTRAFAYMSRERRFQSLYKIIEGIISIEHQDYLSISNIVINEECIFYDVDDNRPGFIYLPVLHNLSYEDFYIQLITLFEKMGINFELGIYHEWNYLLNFLKKEVIDLHRLKKVMEEFLQRLNLQGNMDISVQSISEEKSTIQLKSLDEDIPIIFHIDRDYYIIGRKTSLVDGSLPNFRTVSGKHCLILREGNQFYISDLSSTNGTYVNGTRIEQGEKIPINKDDVIGIAHYSFIVE